MVTKKNVRMVTKWVKLWRSRLLLQHWTIHVEFTEEQPSNDPHCRASVHASERYLSVYIKIHPKYWDDAVNEQERTILHELFHIIVDLLYTLAWKGNSFSKKQAKKVTTENERLTETFTNLLWDAYEK